MAHIIFYDENGGGVDYNLDQFIKNLDYWYAQKAIFAVDNITINSDGWGITANMVI